MVTLISRLTNDGIFMVKGELTENQAAASTYGSAFFDNNATNAFQIDPSSDFSPGNNDFTIEWFQYTLPGKPYPRLFTLGSYPSVTLAVSQEVPGGFYLWANGSAIMQFDMDPYFNKWCWFVISRKNGVICLFQDGKLMGSSSYNSLIQNITDVFYIGTDTSQGTLGSFYGFLTNFRFVNGSGLYTGSSIGTTYYAVPNRSLDVITNTKLLLLTETVPNLLIDSSSNHTVNILNIVSWVNSTPFSISSRISNSATTSYASEFDEITLSNTINNIEVISSGLILNLDSGNPLSYPGSGSVWNDISGNGNNFTLQNNPIFSTEDGGILVFSPGSSQYASGPDFGTLSTFTAEGWVKFHSLPGNGYIPAIITNIYNGGTTLNFSLSFQTGNLSAGVFSSSLWYNTSGILPKLNVWYNFVETYDGSYLKLYVNGKLYSSIGLIISPSTTGIGYYIARRWDNPEYIDGDIPIIRVYNRALDANEILANYNLLSLRYIPVAKRETSDGIVQVSNYFDEVTLSTSLLSGICMYLDAADYISYPNSGTIWYDLSGNGNDVNMVNANDLTWNNTGYFTNSANGFFMKTSANNIPLGTDQYCIGVWCRESFPWQGGGGLIGIGGYANPGGSNFLRTNTNSGDFLNYWWGNDLLAESSTGSNEWIFVLAQYDDTRRSIWVNGIEVAFDLQEGTNVNIDTIYVGNTAYPGDRANKGDIAIAFIYNRILTSDEIMDQFNSQRGRFGV